MSCALAACLPLQVGNKLIHTTLSGKRLLLESEQLLQWSEPLGIKGTRGPLGG